MKRNTEMQQAVLRDFLVRDSYMTAVVKKKDSCLKQFNSSTKASGSLKEVFDLLLC